MINIVEILTSTIENRIEDGQPVPFSNAVNLQNPHQVNMLMFCLELISNTVTAVEVDLKEEEEASSDTPIPENYHCGNDDCEACGEMTLDKYQYINTELHTALKNFFRASNAVELPRGVGKTTRMVVAKALLALLEHENQEPDVVMMPLHEAKEVYESVSGLLAVLDVKHKLTVPTLAEPNTPFSVKVVPVNK